MKTKMIKGLKQPGITLDYFMSRLKGLYYVFKYKIFNKKVKIGKRFKVVKKISIKGPGQVIIGEDVFMDGSIHTVTLWTYSTDAVIKIGHQTFLNGTRFGCSQKIEIGDNCIIADCRIMDTDFHSLDPKNRNNPEYIKKAPVIIGKRVWIALEAIILKGVNIRDCSTISACSVVCNDVPSHCVYGGNPAVFLKKTPFI